MGQNQICRVLVSSPKARSPAEKPAWRRPRGKAEKLLFSRHPQEPGRPGFLACSNGGRRDPEREGGARSFGPSCGPHLSQPFVLLSFPSLSSLSSYTAAPVIPYPAPQLRSWDIGGTRWCRGCGESSLLVTPQSIMKLQPRYLPSGFPSGAPRVGRREKKWQGLLPPRITVVLLGLLISNCPVTHKPPVLP